MSFFLLRLFSKTLFSRKMETWAMATSSSGRGAKRKRSGGIQQRLGCDKKEEAKRKEEQKNSTSQLASFLVEQWVWGKASVQLVQETAKLACEDMVSNGCDQVPPDLLFLAGLGSSGVHSNNMHRELLHHFEKKSPLPPMYTTQVPLKNGHPPQSFLLPHEVFSHTWEHYREAFHRYWMPGGESQISLFWSKFQHHPAMAGHPLFSSEDWSSKAIPISIHGDAVPTAGKGKAWTKMLLVLSWVSCLTSGSTREVCNLLYAVSWLFIQHVHFLY